MVSTKDKVTQCLGAGHRDRCTAVTGNCCYPLVRHHINGDCLKDRQSKCSLTVLCTTMGVDPLDMSPYFFEVEGTPCFVPLLLWGGHFCTNAELRSTDYIYIHRSFRLLVANTCLFITRSGFYSAATFRPRKCNVTVLPFVVCKNSSKH